MVSLLSCFALMAFNNITIFLCQILLFTACLTVAMFISAIFISAIVLAALVRHQSGFFLHWH